MINKSEERHHFLRALSDLNTFHGISMDEGEFIEIGLRAWEAIGNRETYINTIELELNENGYSKLPCGVYRVLAVTMDFQRCGVQMSSNNASRGLLDNPYSQTHTSTSNKFGKMDIRQPMGEYIGYELIGDGIKTDPSLRKVYVMYEALVLDEDGLPMVTSKEGFAIAAYAAYVEQYKKMMKGVLKDPSIVAYLKGEYERLMRDARVFEYLDQNTLDSILNIKVSLERKRYNKSYWLFKDA